MEVAKLDAATNAICQVHPAAFPKSYSNIEK